MIALLTHAACSYSTVPGPLLRGSSPNIVRAAINMWTYEEAAASGIDARYLQMLETRVNTLVVACQGDQCPLMPQQCVGDY